ncbi:hypothetical protein PGTUg99_016270 [Puccinia graminis f. sp. tritici]|uniref:Uncharacterized protein n=1 Tax=Puccinia graminis f. sp. tritici TaxID=56615 RepID=A0A5B0RSK0_PUCGR|nr:hypothetical protein PGTUg99_016270 [Puccinia graminis f. sp. tritici]
MTVENYADFMDSAGGKDTELGRQEEGSGSTEVHDWDNTTLGSEDQSEASPDGGEYNNEWSSNPSTWQPEDDAAVRETEQSEWTPYPECKGSYKLVTITADYVDHGYPVKEFLRMYPETYESTAGGIWDELPGYTAGRIGFIMLLTTNGTKGYLENSYIWPEEWWFVDEERLAMYLGTKAGRMTIADQELWYSGRDREKEEEEFLTELIRQMVGMFGRFDWQAFKWVLRNEQARRGKEFETFWKDWEYAAIAD